METYLVELRILAPDGCEVGSVKIAEIESAGVVMVDPSASVSAQVLRRAADLIDMGWFSVEGRETPA